ncbi:unnamed protein product [Gadus morhua 'NCC']
MGLQIKRNPNDSKRNPNDSKRNPNDSKRNPKSSWGEENRLKTDWLEERVETRDTLGQSRDTPPQGLERSEAASHWVRSIGSLDIQNQMLHSSQKNLLTLQVSTIFKS